MESINFLSFFFVSFAAYLGIAFGLLLCFLAPEEIISGRKYFVFARKMLYITLAALCIYFLYSRLIVALFVFLFLLCAFYAGIFYSYYLQIFLALIFAVSSIKNEFFIAAASLIFIFNMLSPALWFRDTKFKDTNNLKNTNNIEKLKTREKLKIAKTVMTNNLLFFICLLFYFLAGFLS